MSKEDQLHYPILIYQEDQEEASLKSQQLLKRNYSLYDNAKIFMFRLLSMTTWNHNFEQSPAMSPVNQS